MERVLQPLAKSVLVPLVLTDTASAADSEIHKKILQSGASGPGTTAIVISSEKMESIMKKF